MVPPDQVWLPWMVRFAASGPPLANRLKVDKTAAGIPTERSDCLVNIFHYLKNITKSHSLPSSLQLDSAVFEEDLDKANALNEYFYSAFSQSTFVLPDTKDLPSVSDSLSDITVTIEDVYQALTSLQPNKASGPDSIGPRILKNCAASLATPLCHLFLLSLSSKTIPADWKLHKIIPVYKSARG